MQRLIKLLPVGLLLVVLAVAVAACGPTTADKQRQQASDQRVSTYNRAVAQVPNPVVTNFPRRKTLVDAVNRQSEPNHPWYVYVLGQNGNIVNYFVAKSVPVNDCDYLSSTDEIVSAKGDNWQISAPSLEGIYQSGSGCNTLTFFDLTTNAEVQITSMQTYISDRPLKVDAKPIKVKSGG